MCRSIQWNPVKELKADLRCAHLGLVLRSVESGEGIESWQGPGPRKGDIPAVESGEGIES